jgi:hypothetical protein
VPQRRQALQPEVYRQLIALGLGAVTATACVTRSNDAPQAPAEFPPVALALPASARDSTATVAALDSFRSRVDADTAHMTVLSRPLDLGAGATGTLTAWRAGPAWQRVRVSGEGIGFRSDDIYWFHDGELVSAQLSLSRPDQPARVDEVWFRGPDLYRWIDGDGRRLLLDARSTHSDVEALRDRIDRFTALLPATESPSQPTRTP